MEEFMGYSPFRLEPSWGKVLEDELEKPYITELAAFAEEN